MTFLKFSKYHSHHTVIYLRRFRNMKQPAFKSLIPSRIHSQSVSGSNCCLKLCGTTPETLTRTPPDRITRVNSFIDFSRFSMLCSFSQDKNTASKAPFSKIKSKLLDHDGSRALISIENKLTPVWRIDLDS